MAPTYEYECSKGHHFERDQAITDEPLKRCPQRRAPGDHRSCGSRVKRLISQGTSFILRGAGWARDSYGGT